MKSVFGMYARFFVHLWVFIGLVTIPSPPVFAYLPIPSQTMTSTISEYTYIAVGTLHYTGEYVMFQPRTLEFRTQRAIRGKLSGTYPIVLRSSEPDTTGWVADFEDGVQVVLFAADVDKGQIYRNNHFLILPEADLGFPSDIYENLTVDAVEEATRAMLSLEHTESPEAAQATLLKMIASPTPFVRYMGLHAKTPDPILDKLPNQYKRKAGTAYALQLLNDSNGFIRLDALREITSSLPRSIFVLISLRQLHNAASLAAVVYSFLEYEYPQITGEPIPAHLKTSSYGKQGYVLYSPFPPPDPDWGWYSERMPELHALLAEWWSKNSARMLAIDGAGLIPTLESDSPVARWYAITLLTEMAGTDHGFDPDASGKKRAQAVARWQAWLEDLQAQAAK